MPKTSKKLEEDKIKEKSNKSTVTAKNEKTKVKKMVTKKVTEKKVPEIKPVAKKEASKKVATKKTVTKKVATKRAVAKKEADKKPVKKAVSKKATKVSATRKPRKKQEFLTEFYDLPHSYNETVVKILAQNPKRLFVYWEVSENDVKNFREAFGDDFFEKTYPVLLVHNEELNYTFEVPINDFANSWYIDVNDPKTKYVVKLGRKFKNKNDIVVSNEVVERENIDLKNDLVSISSSNELEAPNDHILFEKKLDEISYRDVKTGKEYKKKFSNITKKFQKIYKMADTKNIYEELYEGEEVISLGGSLLGTLGTVGTSSSVRK